MVRFNVAISSILGTAYFHYNIYASEYNPHIDETITVTVEVKNVFGQSVSGKSVTLYKQGTSVSTKTTNSNGVVTWSITCDEWGIIHFDAEDVACEVMVGGWKAIKYGNFDGGDTWGLFQQGNRARFVGIGWKINVNASTNSINIGVAEQDVKPLAPVHYSTWDVQFYGDRINGKLYYVSKTGSNLGQKTMNMQIEWTIGE